jgi:hypothetical protein
MNRVARVELLAGALLLNAAAGHAHSLAGTTVRVTIPHPRIVAVTIAAEADPLIAKLETLAGAGGSHPSPTIGERRARLESLFATLRSNIDARVGATPLELELQGVAVDDTAHAEIRLTAAIPDPSTALGAGGPRVFTWRSTFVFGAYRLAIVSPHAAEVVEWLQGPHTSAPIAFESSPAEGGSSVTQLTRDRIGHSLAMGALVLFVFCRRAAGRRVRFPPCKATADVNVTDSPADSS